MSTSSNISMRQRFRPFARLTDDAIVLVNLDLVRFVEGIPSGLRLIFGNAASDRIDVRMTLDELRSLIDT